MGFRFRRLPFTCRKLCVDTLASPLTRLLNLSMATGQFPSYWKHSDVFPVHEKGCMLIVSNCRNITALSAAPELPSSFSGRFQSGSWFQSRCIIGRHSFGLPPPFRGILSDVFWGMWTIEMLFPDDTFSFFWSRPS